MRRTLSAPPWFLLSLLPILVRAAGGTNAALVVQVEASAWIDGAAMVRDLGSAPSFLANLPGVALRSQGFGAPQADLCIRGAPFSSSGLLLSGLALRNPQTEHFQADLPVPSDVFTSPELLTGLDQFRTSSGHPAGSVALGFAPIEEMGRVEIGGGPDDLFSSARAAHSSIARDGFPIGESAFVEGASMDRTDGFRDNYLNRWSGGAQAQARGGDNQFDLLGAYGWRDFGARGFYGASPLYPAEEQVGEALVAASAAFHESGADPSHVSAGWERSDDRYWLDREKPGLYGNHTVSDVASLHGDRRQPLARNLDLDLRADADEEWIDGDYAGTIPGTGLGTHNRGHVSLAALPRYTAGAFVFTAGGSLDAFTDDGPAWLPAAGIAWRPSDQRQVSLSYTEAVREPSYTELNYESPGSLGNRGLERQQTRTLELAWREQRSSAAGGLALFAEDGRNLVDWVRNAPGGRWLATNLDAVRTYGLLADAQVPVTRHFAAIVSYQALAKESDTDVYASRYVLDYPEHTVRIGMQAQLRDDLTCACWQECNAYADNPARGGPDASWAAHAELRWQVWQPKGLEVALGVENPWNESFEAYPGQPCAERRVYASARHTW